MKRSGQIVLSETWQDWKQRDGYRLRPRKGAHDWLCQGLCRCQPKAVDIFLAVLKIRAPVWIWGSHFLDRMLMSCVQTRYIARA